MNPEPPIAHATAENAAADPVVICVAPNGARRTRQDHSEIPIEPDELAREALRCADAGATVMHLHVRDERQGHSLDVQRYRDAMAAIETAVGARLLVQVTTEAVGLYGPQEQMDLVRSLRPSLASVALKELAPDAASEDEFIAFVRWSRSAGVGLQFILYSPQEAQRVLRLVPAIAPDMRPNVLFVLGRYTAGQQSSPAALLPFLSGWPTDWPWSVCAFGRAEAQCVATAIGLGGHVRVGFENNLHRPDGELAANNADLVRNAGELALRSGRRIADVSEARRIYAET